MMERLIFLAWALLIFGGGGLLWSLRVRKMLGLGRGKTISRDDLVLFSERLKLVGRPDRIVRQGEYFIPEEWKLRARRVYSGHRLQVGLYCLLIEEKFGRRSPFGVVVIQGGERVEVPFTEELQAEVLSMAEKIREHRKEMQREIPVRHPAVKCRSCGQRGN